MVAFKFARKYGKSKKPIFVFCAIAVIACHLAIVNDHKQMKRSVLATPSDDVETATISEVDRPVIYTFYNRIDQSVKNTGMTNHEDDELLEIWKEEWSKAGWEPKILDLHDAESHPRFEEFREKVGKIRLLGPNTVYNQLCYFRWLAMASVGGGWMSDYDVLPMEKDRKDFDPEESYGDGSFAVYASTGKVGPRGPAPGGIPCLMSGSQSEWERLAFSIIDNGLKHPEERLWSDMLALIDLKRQSEDEYILHDLVLGGFDRDWTAELCHETEQNVAVHFSHSDARKSGHSFEERPDVSRNWIKNWKSACKQ